MNANLRGKTAVVTGASSGIGRAISERLAAAGASVFLAGRSLDALASSRERIEASGGRAETIAIDVRDADALGALVDRAAEATGRLDIMVNNAGVNHSGAIVDQTFEQWREMFDVNVLALLAGCQSAIRTMRRLGHGGHVVNISSIAAQNRGSGVYGATKHAVNTITHTLRTELEDEDIRLVSIMPGTVATNIVRNFDPELVKGIASMVGIELEWQRGERIPDEILEQAQSALESALATPEDVAEAVLYAVSAPLRLNISEIVVRPAKQLEF